MYCVKGNGVTIYSDNGLIDGAVGISPKLTLKDNSAGSFEITIPPGNAGYDKLERLSSEIVVYRDNMEIWSGRIISEQKDFWNNRILTCEGELAYLNDTTQPPHKYENVTIRQLLEALLSVHNYKATNNKNFIIGAVTVNDDPGTVYTNNENTLSVINDQLIKKFGGHLRIRKEDGVRYLDYLDEWPSTNSQEIRFGLNLIDFTRDWDMTELATVIMPRGARLDSSEIEELDAYVDVSSVNGGSRYVTNEEAISQFGWIEAVVDWEDVSDPEELLEKAREYLSNQQFDEMTIEVSAVDLRYLGVTCDSIRLLDEVRCISRPHGLDRIFPVTELTIQLDKPDSSEYTLGSKIQNGLTSSTNKVNDDILDRIEYLDRQPTYQTILDSAKDNATQIINSALRGYVTVTRSTDNDYSESINISSDLTYNPNTDLWSNQTKLWRWNINGLGYSKDGGRNYDLAMTMDGSIVADFITTGTLSTVLIKSVDDNSYWNLSGERITIGGKRYEPGEFVMRRGSIQLGVTEGNPDGRFSVNDYGELYAEYGRIGGFTISAYSIYNDVMELNEYGLSFYDGGDRLGYFGTQFWHFSPEDKGITMSLDYSSDAKYIVWSNMDNITDDYSTVKLGYASKEVGAPSVGPDYNGMYADMLHIGCKINMHGWGIQTAYNNKSTGTRGIYQSATLTEGEWNWPDSIKLQSGRHSNKTYSVYIVNGIVCFAQ